MPLKIVCSTSNRTLWNAFLDDVLPALQHVGPGSYPAQIWLTHRLQRDLLLEAAAVRGLKGWLNPPIHFLSSLPDLFGINGRPAGLLARRELISAIGHRIGRRYGIHVGNADASITRGNMLDSFFGDLLPEGVTTDAIRAALAATALDEFAERRNAWVVECYEAYQRELDARGWYDARSIHARVADRIDAGALPAALAGSAQLHIYGLYSARSRRRLLEALARQPQVDVTVYTTRSAADLIALASTVVDADVTSAARPRNVQVQPAPDANREVQWIAARVKRLIQAGAEPHDIAVVARTGRVDTRRAMQALERAGVPATARLRTPLSEVSALKAVLDLFRAAAQQWAYRPLRAVLGSPYLGARLDLRPFDRIAGDARPASLAEWQDELERLYAAVNEDRDPDARRMGISADRLRQVIDRFSAMRPLFERMDEPKLAPDWIALTKELLRDRRFRQRICRAPLRRHDIVRLDQRGVRQLERILDQWLDLDERTHRMTPAEWFRSLRVLLESLELVLTTPGQKGVQILEAHDAALLPFRATFIMHANDGEFPRVHATSGLFTDEERNALSARLPIDNRAIALRREQALWEAVAAGDDVAITYQTTDPAGTPLLPSLLVPPHDRASELPRTASIIDVAVNAEQALRAAAVTLADAMRAETPPSVNIAVPDPDLLRHAVLNAFAERMRGAPGRRIVQNPVNPWNGQLRDPAVLARIRERFNDTYAWSASALESYGSAPFVFLLERILNLREIEEAEDDASALTVGSIAHDLLEGFYRAIAEDLPDSFDDRASQILALVADRVFAERESRNEWLGARILWRERRRQIRETVERYLTWELPYLAKQREVPVEFEFAIGNPDPLVLKHADVNGAIVTMRVTGRIDRIDRDAKGVHHVLDYKSRSYPSSSGYEDGATLQAPLYLEALRALGMTVGKGRYRSLRSPGNPQNGSEMRVDNEKYRTALKIAFTIPSRVHAGLFEAVAAASTGWKSYYPDLSIRRTSAVVTGSRFDA